MPALNLRKRLSQPKILVVPGGGSPLELRLIEMQGFEAGYVSGYATAASRYAEPDIGLIAYADVEDAVLSMRRVTRIPLIVDCDTGYGDVANVVRTVRGMERLGVAAIQIEDQAWPKKCGHMDNKIVEPRDIAIRKVKAAVQARENSDTLIVARTDARGPMGMPEALDRCHAFKDAGADVLFVDGPQSTDELELIGRTLPGPLIANMSETGLTPLHSAAELEQMGYAIALFPSSTVRLTIGVLSTFLKDLQEKGDSRDWVKQMASLEQTNTLLGLSDIRSFEQQLLKSIKG
jgi:2-methylisocitrate lyase-like PEP mutase family enzyme